MHSTTKEKKKNVMLNLRKQPNWRHKSKKCLNYSGCITRGTKNESTTAGGNLKESSSKIF